MNVTVIGGGGIGCAAAADISLLEGMNVTLLTSRPEKFSSTIEIEDWERETEFTSNPITVTSDVESAISCADVVLCTIPSDVREPYIENMSAYLREGTFLGFIPGTGGVEFMCRELSAKGVIIFGMGRVPVNCKAIEYGKIYKCKTRKAEITFSAVNTSYNDEVKELLQLLFGVPCRAMHNYMEIAFVPGNPILHTSRLMTLFKDFREGVVYDEIPFFYLKWDDESSERLLACDEDLQNICKAYSELDLSGIRFNKEHYESEDAKALTAKLRSINSFKEVTMPMLKVEGGYIPNMNSRYFTEDFPYGVVNLKGFGVIADVSTPALDELLHWYQGLVGKEYFKENNELGKDIHLTSAPQKYGYTSKKELIDLYSGRE